MKRPKSWVPVIIMLILTPVALLLGVGSGGAGHGDYFWAKVLFPYTMLSAFLFGSITAPFVLLAVAQFPLYGVGLGYAHGGKQFARLALILLLLHAAAASVVFSLADENFSRRRVIIVRRAAYQTPQSNKRMHATADMLPVIC